MRSGSLIERLRFDPTRTATERSAARADVRFVSKLAMFALILALEALVLKDCLPSVTVDHPNILSLLLRNKNRGTFRFVVEQFSVTFIMVSLIFGRLNLLSHRTTFTVMAQRGMAWGRLAAHLAVVWLFSALTVFLVTVQLSPQSSGVLGAIWLASGAVALALLATAFMPGGFWVLLFRSTRQVMLFSSLVAAGAYGLGRATVMSWQPLTRVTMVVVYGILHPLVPTINANASTFTIGSPDFSVEIWGACSGYEGLGLMLAFLSAWIWFYRSEWRFPQVLVVIPLGLAGIWLLNCLRVAILILIGIAGAPEVAVNGFHSQAGWLAFNVLALGTCLATLRVPWLLKNPFGADRATADGRANPTLPYLVPFLALLAGSMIARLASADFEWLYVIRVALTAVALWHFSLQYRQFVWRIDRSAVVLGVVAFLVWIAAGTTGNASKPGVPLALQTAPAIWAGAWIVFRAIGSVITVPLAEELAFRGFLLRWFDSEDFHSVRPESVSWMAVLLSSVVFGILHGNQWLAGTLAGLLCALAYKHRGSMGNAVAAHGVTNALICMQVLIGGQWQLW